MTISKLETNIYPLNVIDKVNELVDGINTAQTTTNLVTSLSASSTNTQYPSAKCVYDLIGNVETLLQAV